MDVASMYDEYGGIPLGGRAPNVTRHVTRTLAPALVGLFLRKAESACRCESEV